MHVKTDASFLKYYTRHLFKNQCKKTSGQNARKPVKSIISQCWWSPSCCKSRRPYILCAASSVLRTWDTLQDWERSFSNWLFSGPFFPWKIYSSDRSTFRYTSLQPSISDRYCVTRKLIHTWFIIQSGSGFVNRKVNVLQGLPEHR